MTLKERKARLVMENDALRYNLRMQCAELSGPAHVLEQGIQLAHGFSTALGVTAPWRKAPKGKKVFSLPRLLLRLVRLDS